MTSYRTGITGSDITPVAVLNIGIHPIPRNFIFPLIHASQASGTTWFAPRDLLTLPLAILMSPPFALSLAEKAIDMI